MAGGLGFRSDPADHCPQAVAPRRRQVAQQIELLKQPLDVELGNLARYSPVVGGEHDRDQTAHDMSIAVERQMHVPGFRVEPAHQLHLILAAADQVLIGFGGSVEIRQVLAKSITKRYLSCHESNSFFYDVFK